MKKIHPVVFPARLETGLQSYLAAYPGDKIFVLTDENTRKYCLPRISNLISNSSRIIQVKSGEKNKSSDTIIYIWEFLRKQGADRKSLLINLGGGIICDLGAFVASTFKRGIPYLNIPTTLLSMVDAAIGGKTGFNFGGLKNEIGTYCLPQTVIIYPPFIGSLDREQLYSGFAEIMKHALIGDAGLWKKIINRRKELSVPFLFSLIRESIEVKMKIVSSDFHEKGIRKSLNFGHTFGHAIESFCAGKGINMPHGYAVAYGMIYESWLAKKLHRLNERSFLEIKECVIRHFGHFQIERKWYGPLYDLMLHDKKNDNNKLKISLINKIGACDININTTKTDIYDTLAAFYKKK
jgi:3-dehydroquinate synthase